VIYEQTGKPNPVGLFFFRVPRFKDVGDYTVNFKAVCESNRRFPLLSRKIEVLAKEEEVKVAVEKADYSSFGSMKGRRELASLLSPSSRGGGKRQRKPSVEEKFEQATEPSISEPPIVFTDFHSDGTMLKLTVPAAMKKQLVDDWYAVTRSRKLVNLPSKPTIIEILHMYHRVRSVWLSFDGGV